MEHHEEGLSIRAENNKRKKQRIGCLGDCDFKAILVVNGKIRSKNRGQQVYGKVFSGCGKASKNE